MVESHRAILYTEQPAYGSGNVPTVETLEKWPNGLLVYLDVWERQVTALEDDRIREVALGGPDTCTRAEVAWQVRVLFQPQNANDFDCNAFKQLRPHGSGRLRARARLDKPPTELCVIPPESRYRGAENQLYRRRSAQGRCRDRHRRRDVQMVAGQRLGDLPRSIGDRHDGGARAPGPRPAHSLEPGDWVEVVDDAIVMGEEAGPLALVHLVDRDKRTVTLTLPDGVTALPNRGPAAHPLLRRWDHAGDVAAFGGALPIAEQANTDQGLQAGWITLEDGVEIWFVNGGEYRAGDYWLIPARTATGDVEWPDEIDSAGNPRRDADGNPVQALQGVHGPYHYYAPLLLVTTADNREPRSRDCRCAIRPLPCASYLYAYGGRVIGLNNL